MRWRRKPKNSAGKTTAGFGYINNANTTGQRQGQTVARFTFRSFRIESLADGLESPGNPATG